VAIVGENGAGKSTLVQLLCGFYRPTEGRIVLDGVDLAAVDQAVWRPSVTAAFQDYVRFETLLREGVGVGDLPSLDDTDAVLRALDAAGGRPVADGLPDGVDTLLGPTFGGAGLSGGQWQAVSVARGLMRRRPLLVVLDEPAASLDAANEAALFRRYLTVAREYAAANGAITLLVSHRFSTITEASLIVVLDGGRVQSVGTHDQLMAEGGLYAQMYEIQAASFR
jgi:ATP-binding cassette subfamily B protein